MRKRVVIMGDCCCKWNEVRRFIDKCIQEFSAGQEAVIVTSYTYDGGFLGLRYALEKDHQVESYRPNWEEYDDDANKLINIGLIKEFDYIIFFWDGKSPTIKELIDNAKKSNKIVRVLTKREKNRLG